MTINLKLKLKDKESEIVIEPIIEWINKKIGEDITN